MGIFIDEFDSFGFGLIVLTKAPLGGGNVFVSLECSGVVFENSILNDNWSDASEWVETGEFELVVVGFEFFDEGGTGLGGGEVGSRGTGDGGGWCTFFLDGDILCVEGVGYFMGLGTQLFERPEADGLVVR